MPDLRPTAPRLPAPRWPATADLPRALRSAIVGIGVLAVVLIGVRALWQSPESALACAGLAAALAGRRSPTGRPVDPQLQALLGGLGEAAALIDADGRALGPRSAAMNTLLPQLQAGQSFLAALGGLDPEAGCALELGWELMRSQGLPAAEAVGLLPGALQLGGQRRPLRFVPVDEEDLLHGVWVIIGQPEAAGEASAAGEAAAAETLAVCVAAVDDPDGLLDFMDAARDAVLRVVGAWGLSSPQLRQDLRSLREAAAFFRFGGLASAAEGVELALRSGDPSAADLAAGALCEALSAVEGRVRALRPRRREHIELSQAEWIDVQAQIRDGVSADALLDTLYFWGDERAAVRVERLLRQAQDRAERLGMTVEISGGAGDLRMAAGRFARLWSVLPHLLGNALQHGIEPPQDRLALGKPARGLLVVRARACRRPQAPAFGAVRLGCPAPGGTSWVRIDVNDDGRGFERDRLLAWAAADRLPAGAPPRGRPLFSAGYGRPDPEEGAAPTAEGALGEGTLAVLGEVQRLGGCLELQSRPGFGCAITLFLPLTDVDQRAEPAEG